MLTVKRKTELSNNLLPTDGSTLTLKDTSILLKVKSYFIVVALDIIFIGYDNIVPHKDEM